LKKPLGLGFTESGLDPELIESIKKEKKKHAALSLMKMNLKSDKSGFMFFNEVIFGFYRNLYYKSKIFKEGLKNPKS